MHLHRAGYMLALPQISSLNFTAKSGESCRICVRQWQSIVTSSILFLAYRTIRLVSNAWCRRMPDTSNTSPLKHQSSYSRFLPCDAVHRSVRPSVTSRYCTKMAKHRITQTMSYDSPWTLVFWCRRFRRNSMRITPNGGAKYRWGRSNRQNWRFSTNISSPSLRNSANYA